jgi:hypothetical protein
MNKDIFVQQIVPTTGPTFGHCDDIENVRKNLLLIYNEDLIEKFYTETVKNGIFRFFHRYCQYIFSVQTFIIPTFQIRMVFIDCHSDVDAALDFYMATGADLYDNEKTLFMDLFNEIENDKLKDKAIMVVV